LHDEPLLADIYKDVDKLRNGEPYERGTLYIGPEKDRQNLVRDLGSAFKAAKLRLGV